MSDVLYLYGFVPAATPSPPDDLSGMDGRPVEVLPFEGFGAAVSRLRAGEYRGEEFEASLQDLEWVARKGVLHEKVVTWFVDREGILPVRFLTLHSSPDALQAEVERRGETVVELLSRFRDLREWNLKVTYDVEVLGERMGDDSPRIAELDRQIEEASAGRAYLLQRQRDELARELMHEVASRLASELLDGVRPLAREVVQLPVPEVPSDSSVAANAALLIHRDREEAVGATVQELAEPLRGRGMDVSFSGPWAPYRFIEREGSDGEG